MASHNKSTPKKAKLVRDSFTIPKAEFAAIDVLKTRAIALGTSVKKSELLRAGLMVLQGLSDAAFKNALGAVPTLKTGRPSGSDTPPSPKVTVDQPGATSAGVKAGRKPPVSTSASKSLTSAPRQPASRKSASVSTAKAVASRKTPGQSPAKNRPAAKKPAPVRASVAPAVSKSAATSSAASATPAKAA